MIIGVFFLLLGISILFKVIFGLNIPIFRSLIAVFLIYLGIKLLLGFSWRETMKFEDKRSAVFSSGKMGYEPGGDERNHYSTVFGSSTVDLSRIPPDQKDVRIDIDTVFGETKVLINPAQAVAIRANAVFGEARMPDDNMVAFGTMNYRTQAAGTKPPIATIHGTVVFGSLRFIAGPGEPRSESAE